MRKVIIVLCLALTLFSLASSLTLACPDPKPELVEDVNEDGVVDVLDILIVASAFASYPSHPRWNSKADVDRNNVVNMGDIVQVLSAFGTTLN